MATPDPISNPRLDDDACPAVAGRVRSPGRPERTASAGHRQAERATGWPSRTVWAFRSLAGDLLRGIACWGRRGGVILLLAVLHRLAGLLIALRIPVPTGPAASVTHGIASPWRSERRKVGDVLTTDQSAATADHDSRLVHWAAGMQVALPAGYAAAHPCPTRSAARCDTLRQGHRTACPASGSGWLQPLSKQAQRAGPAPGRSAGWPAFAAASPSRSQGHRNRRLSAVSKHADFDHSTLRPHVQGGVQVLGGLQHRPIQRQDQVAPVQPTIGFDPYRRGTRPRGGAARLASKHHHTDQSCAFQEGGASGIVGEARNGHRIAPGRNQIQHHVVRRLQGHGEADPGCRSRGTVDRDGHAQVFRGRPALSRCRRVLSINSHVKSSVRPELPFKWVSGDGLNCASGSLTSPAHGSPGDQEVTSRHGRKPSR